MLIGAFGICAGCCTVIPNFRSPAYSSPLSFIRNPAYSEPKSTPSIQSCFIHPCVYRCDGNKSGQGGQLSLIGHQATPYLITTPFPCHNYFTASKWPSYISFSTYQCPNWKAKLANYRPTLLSERQRPWLRNPSMVSLRRSLKYIF